MNDIIGEVKSHSYLFMDAGLIGLGALLLLPRLGMNLIPAKYSKFAWSTTLGSLAVGLLAHMADPSGRAFAAAMDRARGAGGGTAGGAGHPAGPGGHGPPPNHGGGGGNDHHPGGGGGNDHHPGGDRDHHGPRPGERREGHVRPGFPDFRGWYGGVYYYPASYGDYPYDPYLYGEGYPFDPYLDEFPYEPYLYGAGYPYEYGYPGFPGFRGPGFDRDDFRGHFPGGHPGHPGHPGGGGHPGHPGHPGGGGDMGHAGNHPQQGGNANLARSYNTTNLYDEHNIANLGPHDSYWGPKTTPGKAHVDLNSNLAYSYFAPAIFPDMSYFNKDAYHYHNNKVPKSISDVILPKEIDTSHYILGSRAPIDDFNHMPPTLLSDIY